MIKEVIKADGSIEKFDLDKLSKWAKYISRYKSKNGIEDLAKLIHYALLASYEEYGEQGSTELKEKVLKLLGEHG